MAYITRSSPSTSMQNRIAGSQQNLVCSPEAMRQLMKLPWLGNVAELSEVLHKLGCRYAQGWLVGKPAALADVLKA